MSVEAITCALRIKLPAGNSTAKHVLTILANHANGDPYVGDDVEAWPSIAALVDSTGQDRKTIIANLQKLEAWGLVSDTGKRVGRTGQIVVYALHIGPDLLAEQCRNRNRSNTGTVPKSEQFRSSGQRVPIFRGKSPDIGTRNRQEPSGNHVSLGASAHDETLNQPSGISGQFVQGEQGDQVGTFEGHAEPSWGTPPPAAAVAIAVELRKRGYAITARDPNLLGAVGEGVEPDAVFEFADLYPADHVKCRGSPGYVISAARNQRAEAVQRVAAGDTTPVSRGTTHGNRRRESDADRIARLGRELDAREVAGTG